MPPISKPKLVNRGPAGLLSKLKLPAKQQAAPAKPAAEIKIDNITPGLLPLAVDINSLVSDPENARLHPERNMESIKKSLNKYGQTKPVVVQTSTRIVTAGNGTLQAAKELGWTKIAANFVDFNPVEAAGYGLADNRTAELAIWDFEVVARLDKLLVDAGEDDNVGWSLDELTVLRTTDWTAPDAPTNLDKTEEEVEESETQPGDAELLMKLQVTIDDPKTQVKQGEVWELGKRHLLVVACVIRESHLWMGYLDGLVLFAPYPGPLTPLTLAADGSNILMVQPDPYIAGHILDHYQQIHGEGTVRLAQGK